MLRYYHYRQLSRDAQNAYKAIAIAIKSYKRSATFTTMKNLQVVLDAVKNDNPHFFYVDWYNSMTYTKYSGEKTELDLKYNMSRSEAAMYFKRAYKIAQSLQGSDERSTILKVHDYMVTRVNYDEDAYKNKKFVLNDHRMIGALFENLAVCEGIARATQFLLRNLGIDCTYVRGQVEGGMHGWNLVYIDNKTRKLDVTWDINLSHGGNICHTYFLI